MNKNDDINKKALNLTDFELKCISKILEEKLDFYLNGYKLSTIERRINKRLKALQIATIRRYITHLENNMEEVRQLADELLINVTAFFRDTEVFNLLQKEVLPTIVKRGVVSEKPIRIWIAGCATGEEAYSFAMIIRELELRLKQKINIKIIATDIDKKVVGLAKKGVYTTKQVSGLSHKRLSTFFTESNGFYEVKKSLKNLILFTVHDVSKDPPFGKVNLVSCRNLLIYFEKSLQEKILANLNFAINIYGFLLLGKSETAISLNANFKTYNNRLKIFQKINTQRLAHNFDFEVNYNDLIERAVSYKPTITMDSESLAVPFQNIIYKNYSPALVVIDHNFYVQHITKKAKEFIETPEDYTILYNFLKLAPPEISAVVRTAMADMKKTAKTYYFDDISVKNGNKEYSIDISIAPLKTDYIKKKDFYVIHINTWSMEKNSRKTYQSPPQKVDKINLLLQKQLEITEANLNASIQELEHSNQNLQASNEELQSTNEEYISVNEELQIINNDYQNTISELSQLNNALAHLMQSTEIGTLFLDKDLVIRKLTNPVTKLINISEDDIDRPIQRFTYNFDHPNFIKNIREVIDSQKKIEFKIQHNKNKKWFLLRITPYNAKELSIYSVVINFIDIDDLKKTQLRLEESEYEYRTLFEKGFDGIVIFEQITLDKPPQILLVNQKYADYLGYSRAEIKTKTALELSPSHQPNGESSASFLQKNIEIFLEKDYVQHEWLYQTKIGEFKYAEVAVFYIDKKKNNRCVAILRDITQQKIAQQKLIQSKNRFQALFDYNALGIALSSKNETIVKTNPMFQKMFGYTQSELENMAVSTLTNPDDWTYNNQQIGALLKGYSKQAIFEKRYIRKDGTIFLGQISLSKFEENNQSYMLASIRDVTQERANEKALRNSEARIKAVFNNTFQFTGLLDTTGKLIEANETALQFGGLKPKDVIGKFIWNTYWFQTSKSNQNKVKKSFFQALKGAFIRFNLEVYSANQTLRMIDFSIKPVFDDSQNIISLIPEGRDITEMLEAKQKLAEKLTELANTNSKLEKYIESNLELENFAYITSHDLREPIRSILGFTQLLQQKCAKYTDKEVKEYLKYIIDASHNINELIDDLLIYSQIDKRDYQMRYISIPKLIRTVLKDLDQSIKESNIKVIINEPLPHTILAHKSSIYRVLLNLVANAIKFRKKDATKPEVIISIIEKPKVIQFEITDNGIGIEAEYFDRIFLMFKRLHTKNDYKGTGMGLAICRKIIEKHKGTIGVQSKYGQGSTFFFTIPNQKNK